jgi:hypothetical protein
VLCAIIGPNHIKRSAVQEIAEIQKMVKYFTSIPPVLIPWIQQQKLFFVATAPLTPSGHVNLSPKGFENTFHIVDESRVWYEDLTGVVSPFIYHRSSG